MNNNSSSGSSDGSSISSNSSSRGKFWSDGNQSRDLFEARVRTLHSPNATDLTFAIYFANAFSHRQHFTRTRQRDSSCAFVLQHESAVFSNERTSTALFLTLESKHSGVTSNSIKSCERRYAYICVCISLYVYFYIYICICICVIVYTKYKRISGVDKRTCSGRSLSISFSLIFSHSLSLSYSLSLRAYPEYDDSDTTILSRFNFHRATKRPTEHV